MPDMMMMDLLLSLQENFTVYLSDTSTCRLHKYKTKRIRPPLQAERTVANVAFVMHSDFSLNFKSILDTPFERSHAKLVKKCVGKV